MARLPWLLRSCRQRAAGPRPESAAVGPGSWCTGLNRFRVFRLQFSLTQTSRDTRCHCQTDFRQQAKDLTLMQLRQTAADPSGRAAAAPRQTSHSPRATRSPCRGRSPHSPCGHPALGSASPVERIFADPARCIFGFTIFQEMQLLNRTFGKLTPLSTHTLKTSLHTPRSVNS